MEIIRNKKRPRGITGVIAAVEGFGKTTTVAGLPGVYMLDADDGSYGLDCPIIRFNGTVAGMMALIAELKGDKCPPDLQNLGIDTADMLVSMLTADLCKRKGWASMEDKDYGKCWGEFKPEWKRVVGGLKDVARAKGINVIWTLHVSGDKTYTEKTTGKQWNRWMARLTPKCAEELYSTTDFYFSGIYDTQTMEQKSGRAKLNLSVGEERTVYTEHSSDHDGKCRLFVRMPDGSKMPKSMSLGDFQKALPGILAASTDRQANPGDFAEPKDDKRPDPSQDAPSVETASEPSPSESGPVAELRKLMASFGVDEAKFRAYVGEKLNSRYGLDLAAMNYAEWPEEAVLMVCRNMDKIAPKAK